MGIFEDAIDSVANIVFDALRSLCFWLDGIIYKMIIYVYNWFMMLCQGRLLGEDSMGSIIKTMTDRISLILGIVMFFIVAISFLRMILEPDKVSDREMGLGSIIKKVILVVIMLALSSTVFNLLYDVQSLLLGNNSTGTNVIQNLFSPEVIAPNEEGNYGDFGAILAVQLMDNFYTINTDAESSQNDDPQLFLDCNNYNIILQNQILNNYNFEFGQNCLNAKVEATIANSGGQTSEVYVMQFMSVESVIVGIIIVYMLLMYCIKVGVRMVQLAFLEIISPMVIVSYLSPKKDTMFDKWKNIYISTYIDVFVRVAIINFVVYLIALILNTMYSTEDTGNFWSTIATSNSYTQTFMLVIMILALLTFAKRAPELLKEILPQGGAGSIGYGIGKKDNELGLGLLGGLGAKGAGVLGGAVGGVVGGFVGGGLGSGVLGLLRGGVGGLKNKKLGDTLKSLSSGYDSQKNAALRTQQRIAEGGSRIVMPGAQRRAARYDQQLKEYEASIGYFDAAEKEAESKALRNAENYVSYNGNSLALLAKLKDDQSVSAQQRQLYESEYNDTLKAAKEFNINYGRDVKNGEVWFDNSGNVDALAIGGSTYTGTAISSNISSLGDSNVVINANMEALLGASAGVASGSRFATADAKNKASKTAKTNLTISNQDYQRAKVDAQYSGKK